MSYGRDSGPLSIIKQSSYAIMGEERGGEGEGKKDPIQTARIGSRKLRGVEDFGCRELISAGQLWVGVSPSWGLESGVDPNGT